MPDTLVTKLVKTLEEEDWDLLLKRIKWKACTPFLGSEVCQGMAPAPSEIAKEWASKYDYPFSDTSDLPRVAQFLAVKKDPAFPRYELQELLKKRQVPDSPQAVLAGPPRTAQDATPVIRADQPHTDLTGPPPAAQDATPGTRAEPAHTILASLPLPIYLTTNFDNFMEDALKEKMRDVEWEWCRWNEPPEKIKNAPSIFKDDYDPQPEHPVVYHLFGHIKDPRSLVLTEDDHLDYLVRTSSNPNLIPARIQEAFSQASLLFLGYRPTDLDFRVLLRSLATYLNQQDWKHVSVQMITTGEMVSAAQIAQAYKFLEKRFKALKIEVCWGSSQEFVTELKQRWEAR